jgi:microcystin-dependent protein
MATFTITPTQTFISGDTVLPATLNQLALSNVALTAGTVAVADLAAATVERLLPAGAVMAFGFGSPPPGWLIADGSAVSRATYASLFAAISTLHGVGDGSTTFNLPDLRGIFVRGSGSQTIGGITYSGTFPQKQADVFRSHNHGVNDPTHQHSYTDQVSLSNGVFSVGGGTGQDGVSDLARLTGFNSTGISIQSTGGSETHPANIALLYCIKF